MSIYHCGVLPCIGLPIIEFTCVHPNIWLPDGFVSCAIYRICFLRSFDLFWEYHLCDMVSCIVMYGDVSITSGLFCLVCNMWRLCFFIMFRMLLVRFRYLLILNCSCVVVMLCVNQKRFWRCWSLALDIYPQMLLLFNLLRRFLECNSS